MKSSLLILFISFIFLNVGLAQTEQDQIVLPQMIVDGDTMEEILNWKR